jgi:hypothetical protein
MAFKLAVYRNLVPKIYNYNDLLTKVGNVQQVTIICCKYISFL